MLTLSNGTPEQKAMAQDALNRWWWPSMMMFGPNDKDSPNSADMTNWRVKRESNDDLRQRFVDRVVPQADFLGITIPDEKLKWNAATQHYDFGDIDWTEFHAVISGHGPCNRERMSARIKAHEDGKWVREASAAYAEKKRKKAA